MGPKKWLDRKAEEWSKPSKGARQSFRVEQAKPGSKVKANISHVGRRTQAGLACPKCGGTSFKAKRSLKGKALGGLVLAPKSRVKCETCGTEYLRG